MRLGIDTGGTFTDVVTLDGDGRLDVRKVQSTPGEASGILSGIEQAIETMDGVDLFLHGTTLATNALIEKKGARCALIGTLGFRDLLEVRRAHRPREGMLDLSWDPPPTLIPRRFRFTVQERVNYRGDVLADLDETQAREILAVCRENGITAIAVSLINAFKNPINELRLGELIAEEMPDIFYTLSHQLVPVIREFERTATVAANVFIGPQVRDYLGGLSEGCDRLGLRGDLLMMQSHGGVTSVPHLIKNPVRAARSGPVAGVIAAARIGEDVGVRDLVSLDMGGTSCDISVVRDGQPTITEDSKIEFGLPVLFPSVLIETIGAGGGSIAWVDGHGRLRSGPQSAGADPGPASYGRGGGEPTTTDAHVVLGTLASGSLLGGEMQLDAEAAHRAIGSVAEQLGQDPIETAAGIIRVANSIMEQGVRRMTIERAHDPRDLSLVAFGGAGPLHAAAIARAMQISEVIVPPYPGVTSALGLLYADLRHDHLVHIGAALPLIEPATIDKALADGTTDVRERLLRERVTEENVEIAYTFNMKYAGGLEPEAIPVSVQLEGSVTRDWLDELGTRFHEMHEKLYNYAMLSYPVEVESLRVEGVGRIPTAINAAMQAADGAAGEVRQVFFPEEGEFLSTPVYQRTSLAAGSEIVGPAVIEQFDATTLVEPGMSARVDDAGNVRITVQPVATQGVATGARAASRGKDPFTVDVLRNAFASIVDEMGAMLARCAMSPVITQGKDFSGAVTTASGDLVMLGELVLPGHVGTMPFRVQSIVEDFGEDIRPGDVFVTNDPYRGGTHLPDIGMLKPIFADGKLIAWVINLGHFIDVGGGEPGSFVANAKDCFSEGLLVPPAKFRREGVLDEAILNIFTMNCRLPEINRADLLALAISLDLGEERFSGLIQRYGADTILEMFEEHINQNEQSLRAIVQALPDGDYAMTDYVDMDPGSRSQDPLETSLTMRIVGDELTFDFTKAPPRAWGAINGTLPVTTSAIMVCLKAVFPEIDFCEGINRAIKIETVPGSFHHALWPVATSGMSATSFQKAFDLTMGCLAHVVPDKAMACPAAETNYVQAGDDPREDTLFDDYIFYLWTEGGYGARQYGDSQTYITIFASGTMNQSIEVYEQLYPILWEKFEYIPDSGGAGFTRGGLGTVRRVRLTYGASARLSSFGDRELFPPWGVYGGEPGLNQGFVINAGTDDEESIGVMITGYDIERGDVSDYWSGGGGGFGDPLERPVEAVLEDVKDGYVSVEGARRDYGVVVNAQGRVFDSWCVDQTATDGERSQRAAVGEKNGVVASSQAVHRLRFLQPSAKFADAE